MEKGEENVSLETVERCHKDLIQDLEQKGFEIVAGRDDVLVGLAVESAEDIEKRVDADIPRREHPIFAGYDRGYAFPVFSRATREETGWTKEKVEEWLDSHDLAEIENTIKPARPFDDLQAGSGDVIEWGRIRCLVAEKTSDTKPR